MARHASNLADVVYITDDNPRYESPKKLEIKYLSNKNAIVIPDRKLSNKKSNKKTRKTMTFSWLQVKAMSSIKKLVERNIFLMIKQVVLKTIGELKV